MAALVIVFALAPMVARADDTGSLSAGGDHSCAMKATGGVVCWGDNSYGQAAVPAGLSLPAAATPTPTPAPAPDLSIAIGAGGNLRPASTISYTLTIRNRGTGPTTGLITVTNSLPQGVTPVRPAANGARVVLRGGWTCLVSRPLQVTCTRPAGMPLAAGAVATIALSARIGAQIRHGATLTDRAAVQTMGDSNAANDRATLLARVP